MAPALKKCCVGDCNSTSSTHKLFSIPQNDYLRNIWMSRLVPTNSSLGALNKYQLLNKSVCEKHFDETQFDGFGVRLRFSFPSLFSEKEMLHGIPLSSEDFDVLSEHNYSLAYSKHPDENPLRFCTAEDSVSCLSVDTECILGVKEDPLGESIPEQEDGSATLGILLDGEVYTDEQTSTSYSEAIQNDRRETPVVFESSSSKSLYDFSQGTTDQGETEIHQKCNTIDTVSHGNNASETLQPMHPHKECNTTNTDSLNNASEKLESPQVPNEVMRLLRNFECLNEKAKTFIFMQLRNARRKKAARRFTLDEKLFALSIMNKSPRCYELLAETFALPNKRTLTRFSAKDVYENGVKET